MSKRSLFYLVIGGIAIANSWLLSKPNIVGKVGLFIYHFKYLRTFPRALLTVGLVIMISILATELMRFLVKKEVLGQIAGKIIMWVFVIVAAFALIKTGLAFASWAAGHIGHRFKYGAYLLPALMLAIFVNGLFSLPEKKSSKSV